MHLSGMPKHCTSQRMQTERVQFSYSQQLTEASASFKSQGTTTNIHQQENGEQENSFSDTAVAAPCG